MESAAEIYNQEYRDKYLVLAQTTLGKAIYYTRWALIEKYVKSGNVLDYGSGPGAFNACGSQAFNRFNYDINPTCEFTTRVWEESLINGSVCPRLKIDVLTMWDSIEHVPNFYNEIKEINPEWIFISTPNLESVSKPVITWKHYRPKEHIFYFDRHSLEVVLEDLGYDIKEINFDEGKLRDPEHPDAIIAVVAKKRA